MNLNTIASDTLVEAIARAIAEGQGDDFDHAHRDKPHWIETRGESGGRYRDINEPRQPDYIDAAQAALTAITEAGFVVCPREPTEAMTVLMAEAVEAATEIIADGNFDRAARLQALAAHAAFIDAATNNGKAE